MIKIVSDTLELLHFLKDDVKSIDIINNLTCENRYEYFGEMEYLLKNIECGYIIYTNKYKLPVGFITISTTNEI